MYMTDFTLFLDFLKCMQFNEDNTQHNMQENLADVVGSRKNEYREKKKILMKLSAGENT